MSIMLSGSLITIGTQVGGIGVIVGTAPPERAGVALATAQARPISAARDTLGGAGSRGELM